MITDLKILEKELIKIENINNWLIKVPTLHPDSDKYDKLWSKYTKHCIEGLWAYDNGGWRYMPGTLFFYGNFFRILDWNEAEKIRKPIKPIIRDIDWMIHYAYLEAQGFSGWKNDEEYTSDYIIFDKEELESLSKSHSEESLKRYADLHNSKGELKKFIHPRLNIKMLHNNKKGAPLYHNSAKNLMIFGARGGRFTAPLIRNN